MDTVVIKWVESRLMVGMESRGNAVVTGGSEHQEPKWQGLKSSDLLLLAAASCSAYDVVNILTKAKEPLEGLEVRCRGEQMQEPPYRFTQVHLEFHINGRVDEEKAKRAIDLSHDKYCSVTNTLRAGVDVGAEFSIQA
jgi:putative redox protein